MSFFILITSDISDYTSIVDFKKNTRNYSFGENFVDSSNLVKTNSFNDPQEVNSKSINLLEKVVNYILTIQVVHDSDNDKIICNNFLNKFISNIKLYERIGVFKPNSSSKILHDVLNLKNSLCNSPNTNMPK